MFKEIVLSILFTSLAMADSSSCLISIKKCILKNQEERYTCLSDISTHDTSCLKTPTFELLASRYSLKESKNPISIESVDHTCISSFDISLSTAIAKDSILPTEVQELQDKLDRCSQKASINLFRP